MNFPEYEELLSRWRSALNSYEIPLDIAKRTSLYLVGNEKDKGGIQFRVFVAELFAKRRELMEKQKRAIRDKPTERKKDLCFLCENIEQARTKGDNLLLDFDTFEDYVFIPNKYPLTVGHSLLCAKEHCKLDETSSHLTEEYLSIAIEVAEKYAFLFQRNHPLAGMSIPGHEHLQFHQAVLQANSGNRVPFNGLDTSGLTPTDYGEDVFSVANSKFDTLALKGEQLTRRAFSLIEQLIERGKIFTFAFSPRQASADSTGTFYLTPHTRSSPDKKISGGDPLYVTTAPAEQELPDYTKHLARLREYLFNKGSFSWADYFK